MAVGFILRLYNLDSVLVSEHRFPALPIRIGRNPLNDCQIAQNFVSDFHARVDETDGRVAVRDLGSKNGIFLRQTKDTTPLRVQPQLPVDLGAHGNEFFIGPFLRAELYSVDMETGIDRPPASVGTVLGNKQMLRAGLGDSPSGGQNLTPAPGLPAVGALPPFDGRAVRQPYGSVPPGAQPNHYQASGPNAPPYGQPYTPPAGSAYPSGHPPRASGAPQADLKGTGHFDLSSELLALQGLRELAGSLLPGQSFQTKGDIARLITKLHDTVEVFCRCFIPLRDGHAQFVSAMDLQKAAMQRSVNRSRSYMAVEMANSPGAVAAALLDWKDPSLDAPKAIEGIFADLMLHQVALLDSLMQGVHALIDELSPENIERIVDAAEGRNALGFVLGRYKSLWEAFVARHEELSEEKQAFGHIFGPEFTQAYRDYGRRRPGTP